MFFTHCRGRIALTTPTIRLAGGPATFLSTPPTSLLITLHLSSANGPPSSRAASRPPSPPGGPMAHLLASSPGGPAATIEPGGCPVGGRRDGCADRHAG